MERASEHRLRNLDLADKKKDLDLRAPYGLPALHKNVVEVQTRISDLPPTDPAELGLLPAEHGELEKLSATLKKHLEAKDAEINTRENGESSAETTIAQKRNEEMAAKQALAACKATAKNSREELQRLPAEEQILQRIDAAERALQEAAEQLRQTELTDKEMTIHERLDAAQQSFTALEQQIRATAEKYNVIKGRLQESEGLHAKRSSTAARVEELTRLTEIESLEKDAVDRLYALFEECRDKQLGTVMEPIHNRVLSWMCGLDIGNYGEVRFNDAFLPDKLVSRDGTSEFALHEESTGAQEQIGMLVRLALGSTLASADEPAVAVLDDPLTHCDIGRLTRMRAILRRATEGDQKLTPPAGPLQIVIFTCHPEWFRDERATVIDLENQASIR